MPQIYINPFQISKQNAKYFSTKKKMQKDEKYLCKSLQFREKGLSLHHRSNEAEGKRKAK
jgi:hypothetical protein